MIANKDFGPEANATSMQIESAIRRWQEWLAEWNEKKASSKLTMASALKEIPDREEAAHERLREIIKMFPETNAAREARTLLNR